MDKKNQYSDLKEKKYDFYNKKKKSLYISEIFAKLNFELIFLVCFSKTYETF